jgi:hypothetical protein
MNIQTQKPQDAAFRVSRAILHSLRWGFIATVILSLLSLLPVVSVLPQLVFVASLAFFNLWLPETGYELWAALAGAVACVLVLAAFHFINLFFLHQITNSNARNA